VGDIIATAPATEPINTPRLDHVSPPLLMVGSPVRRSLPSSSGEFTRPYRTLEFEVPYGNVWA
jgi:hypothetical protein